jgi:hypothetical protein
MQYKNDGTKRCKKFEYGIVLTPETMGHQICRSNIVDAGPLVSR